MDILNCVLFSKWIQMQIVTWKIKKLNSNETKMNWIVFFFLEMVTIKASFNDKNLKFNWSKTDTEMNWTSVFFLKMDWIDECVSCRGGRELTLSDVLQSWDKFKFPQHNFYINLENRRKLISNGRIHEYQSSLERLFDHGLCKRSFLKNYPVSGLPIEVRGSWQHVDWFNRGSWFFILAQAPNLTKLMKKGYTAK
jgi:hypothetical protein